MKNVIIFFTLLLSNYSAVASCDLYVEEVSATGIMTSEQVELANKKMEFRDQIIERASQQGFVIVSQKVDSDYELSFGRRQKCNDWIERCYYSGSKISIDVLRGNGTRFYAKTRGNLYKSESTRNTLLQKIPVCR
ncbi:MAG: hypothetical protein KC478_14915 [Bacteriovoracaceae bacterium]|nr:hypothetical protein [Bacteriovoracaceae bacterium]